MAEKQLDWPLQIEPLTNDKGERILDSANRPQSVLKVIDVSTLPDALRNIKAAIERSRHGEIDTAINNKMGQFIWRVYSWQFAENIRPLNEALKQAQAGKIEALVNVLWISNITPEWIARVQEGLRDTANSSVAQERAREKADLDAKKTAEGQAAVQKTEQLRQEAANRARWRAAELTSMLGGKP